MYQESRLFMAPNATIYPLTFCLRYEIDATVTSSSQAVAKWIELVEYIHLYRLNNLVVGLDIEWRPNIGTYIRRNPVAVLQLCVGRQCLVFQLCYADAIPQALRSFLGNGMYTFVGVGIADDVQMLFEDYGLQVSNVVDLRSLASTRLKRPELKHRGLVALANEVMGVDYSKSMEITVSDWSQRYLNDYQVGYAAVDAFISFETGKLLGAAHFVN